MAPAIGFSTELDIHRASDPARAVSRSLLRYNRRLFKTSA